MSNIAVIGTGYVGLTTGAYLAHLGHQVTCADVVPEKVERLSRGEVPIVEPGLDELVQEGINEGRLSFVLGAANAVPDAEFIFLCLPTPQGEDGSADLSYVSAAAREIGPLVRHDAVVINKSTVPVGSTKIVEAAMERSDVYVVSNPEFLREGSAVFDCLNPDRIVIGSEHKDAAIRVSELFNKLQAPLVVTDPASAETIKYASNAFLATKISFINAMANVCEAIGADVKEVALGMGFDKRIGFEFLKPGPGWGGSCFPKDSHALVKIADDAGYEFSLMKSVVDVNNKQYDAVADKIRIAAGGDLSGKTIGVWGLTFKANTDDLRDSPSLYVINRLVAQGARVKGYDVTQAREHAPHHPTLDKIEMVSDAYEAAEGADVVAVMTEWNEFRWLDFAKVKEQMVTPIIVDARNILDAVQIRRKGFDYTGVGRP
jgi:UDPglucose 6-dehydrogenase